ncbi:MAG TPA: efflux RND transporter periplasmic adaptor subunit [Urbifossiella sp.]|nr:efflux RND transporter periplasmic adaptor subunit [Urbifossiella sp.]
MTRFPQRLIHIGRYVGIAALLVVAVGAAAILGASGRSAEAAKDRPSETANQESLKRVGASSLIVPNEMATRMALRTGTAEQPSQYRSLPSFTGTLAVDNNALSRVYSRFPGEVVALGKMTDSTGERPLRVGDRVTKGQLLATVSSTVLGEKKSELVDALSKLRRDEIVLASYSDPALSSSVPTRSIVDAQRDVETDRVAVDKAERTLRSWRLSETEIAKIRVEAAELAAPGARRRDPTTWPLSPITAPRDGVIIERNTSVSAMVDASSPLFLVADLSHLAVWAHVYEEDLPLLQSLPRPVQWKVNVPSRPGSAFPGTLETIGAVIHPDQHTALISGLVANPDGSLRAGMFVTVSVKAPPPQGEIEVPSEAVVEDGRESLVFVRASADPTSITRHRVKVVRRFRELVYLAADSNGVHPGDHVITSGSLLLNEAMNEVPAPRR